MIAKKSNWGPRSRLKMKMKAGRMVFPTHYFTLVSEKVEIALILPQKVIQSDFSSLSTMNSLGPRNWMYSGLLHPKSLRTAHGKPLFEP